MYLSKKDIKKIIGIICFGITFYFILENLETVKNVVNSGLDVVSPFLIGSGVAFILNSPMSWFEKKVFASSKLKNGKTKKSTVARPVSIMASILFLIFIVSFIIKLVIPQLISVIVMFVKDLPGLALDIKEWAINLTRQYPDISNQIKNIEIDWNSVTNDIFNFTSNLAGSLVTSSIGFIISFVGGVFDFIISFVFAIYILSSKEKLKSQVKNIIKAYFCEDKANYILKICALSKTTFYNFFTGQCTEALILGTLCFLGMLILRLPYAITISVLVAVTALIPIVGAFIGIIIGAILILSVEPIKAAIFIIFLIILQQIESNAIYPRVVGNSVGLPGMWVLVAVVVGGSFAGILGLLLGLPTVSVLYTIFKNDVTNRLNKKKIEEE